MLNADRDSGCVSSGGAGVVRAVLLAAMATLGVTGCNGSKVMEPGFANQCRTQLLFYSPPGAVVSVQSSRTRTHQVAETGPFEHRLEYNPEEFCVFNLYPGRYEFKYTSAEGLPGVSVYGELEVFYANWQNARVFQRRAFVPIALPSEYYRSVTATGDEIFPYRGENYRTAIDEHDLQRLKQGDVIEKVFVVADLERAEKVSAETERDLAACEREIEYADARFRLAYIDFRIDVADPSANFWRTDRDFIDWERKRVKLQQKLDDLLKLQDRTEALLKCDHVLVKDGMLVLATEEVVKPHRDVVNAAEDLGEVLLVMRIGGRHMHWGDPRRELAVYEQ